MFSYNGLIQNNLVSNNLSDDAGGGISGSGIIRNNLVVRNSASRGGGMFYTRNIWNNTVCYNVGGGISWGSRFGNNIIWGNRSYQLDPQYSDIPSFSNIQNWTSGGEGNISLDPQFVDAANEDFHLRPTSPCIDAGTSIENLLTDIEGNRRGIKGTTEQRGDGSNYDIGAFEYVPSSSAISFKVWNMYE